MTTAPVRDSLTMSTAHRRARRLPIPAPWPVRSGQAAHPWAIISAGLAPVLLTGAYLIAGILQPAAYSKEASPGLIALARGQLSRWAGATVGY